MLTITLLSLSAEFTVGVGQAAPSQRAVSQTPYGEVDWGYRIWTNFFGQLTYVKGVPLGTEPYIRIGIMDHPMYEKTIYYNNLKIGARLNEAITSYEIGFSKPLEINPPFHLYWGAAFTGNFCRWERTSYGASDIKIIDQVTPGLVGFGRAEWWWKYREYLAEDRTINCIIGLSPRFYYMGFRPSFWPCPDWFCVLEGYVGVRW